MTTPSTLTRVDGAFLRMAGGVVLGAASMPMLAACAPGAPGGSAGSAAKSAASSGGKVKLPTHTDLAEPAWRRPAHAGWSACTRLPALSQPADQVGGAARLAKGATSTGLTASLSTAPTPLENNPAWQQVNRELGVTLKIPSISTTDFPTRLNTVVTGTDLPDIVAAAIFQTTMPNIGDFLNSAART